MDEITEYPQAAPAKRSSRALKAVVASVGGVVVAAGLTFGGITLGPPLADSIALSNYNTAQAALQAKATAAPAGQVTTADTQQTMADSDAAGGQAIVDAKAAIAAQAAVAEAARVAAVKAAAEQGPTKCPAGTHAMAVDANGNESNCDPLNGSGQPCEAYNDQNQCVAWLQP